MKKTVENLVTDLLHGLKEREMSEISKKMDVSLATAYRYRKAPLDMPLKTFLALTGHFDLHLDIRVTLHQEELVEAEELRLSLEQSIAAQNGYRLVTTPHFSVNCELPEITDIKFKDRYDKEHWPLVEQFIGLRKKRHEAYLDGSYKSEEIINGDAYMDFFLRRNLFADMSDDLWTKQHAVIVETASLPNVTRHIYMRATPELPVMLCYSTGDTIIRLSDLTIKLSKDHFAKAEGTLRKFVGRCKLSNPKDVRNFLIDPLRMKFNN